MILGEIIKEYRQKNDMTMEEFAKICNRSKGFISMLEKGKNPQTGKPIIPSLETIKQVSNAINIDFGQLINMLDDNQNVKLTTNDENVPHNEYELKQAVDGLDKNDIQLLIDMAKRMKELKDNKK